MAKRFIDTDIWKDEWFTELSNEGKLFFIYYITSCDSAGFLKLNRRVMCFHLNIDLDSLERVIKEFDYRIKMVNEVLMFMPNFVLFQHPKGLSESNKPQKAILDLMAKNGVSYNLNNKNVNVNKEYPYSLDTVQDKEKDKEKEKDKDKEYLVTSINNGVENFENEFPHYTTRIEEEQAEPQQVNHAEFFEQSIEDELWLEGVMRYAGLDSIKKVQSYMTTYYEMLNVIGKQHPTLKKYREHFANWTKLEVFKGSKPTVPYEL
jgi:hypothetical protein